MSRRAGIWAVLGIDRTDDLKAIRKAYADKLKAMDIDREAANYAILRDARDSALRWARSQALAPAGPAEADDEWGLGVPEPEQAGAEAGNEAAPDRLAEVPADNPPPAAEPSAEDLAQLPDKRLDYLLFPNGEVSQEPFTYEEGEDARRALAELIADILGGDIGRQRHGDYWLADRLANGWPRSAPLLADAAEAFEWEKGRGQLGEGPAQAFLNARLRGLHFYDAVQDPDHWAHRAWKELATPGDRGWFGRFRANKGDVDKLLRGIRENFPEVESYLDPRKVATWEPAQGNPWKMSGGLVFAIFIGLQALRFCSVPMTHGETPYELPVAQTSPERWTPQDRKDLVAELFGSDTTFDAVQLASPFLAERIRGQMRVGTASGSKEIVRRGLIDTLRRAIFLSANDAGFADLVRIKQFKLKLVERAAGDSDPACVAMVEETRLFDSVTLPEDLRMEERALALRLLNAGRFAEEPGPTPSTKAQIPGEIFARAERASGVSGKLATQAALGEGTQADRCAFRKALMAEVLRQPGTVSAGLLKLL